MPFLDSLRALVDNVTRGAPAGPVPAIPPAATFRRAVGLEMRLRPCSGLGQVKVTARRHGGESTVVVPLAEAALLCRMGRWMTSSELGIPHHRATRMVADNLAFFAPEGRPTQEVTTLAPPQSPSTSALRRNVWATPIMARGEAIEPVPFMPRMGALDGAELVGMHFGVMEMGQQVLGIGLSCCRDHALELMDIAAGSTRNALAEALCTLGILEDFAARPSTREAHVTWLGHAAVLVELDGERILVDPLFHPASIPHRPQEALPPDPRVVSPTAVLITHGDNDHLNPQALARIPRSTRIILPRVDGKPAHQVDMRALVTLLGFSNITEVDAWERVQLGAVSVVAAPFAGEDWGLRLANRTYVIQGTRHAVYCNADSAPMRDVVERIAREHRIDLALVGVGGCEEARVMPPGFGYGNFYAPFMDKAARNEWLKLCSNPDDAADTVIALGAKKVFGYAAGGADFIAVAYSDRGTHSELEAALSRRGARDRAAALPLGEPFPLT